MSTSKHIDKICIAAIAVTLILAILFMNGASLGLTVSETAMGYETRLFDTDTVHTIDIVMNDWDSFIENCENEEYSACTVLIDGEKYSDIGIRAKGNTSLSSVSSMGSQRYSFKLEFDQYQDGRTYYGLDKLCLNNLIQDNTMMKDYVVYQMMAEFGVDTPLCSYVYITVNGEDWGLYLAVEGVEDSFLERNYGSDTGELYKPDSLSFGGGRGNGQDFSMDDFAAEADSSANTETADSSTAAGTSGGDSSSGSAAFGGGDFPGMPAMGSFDASDMPDTGSFDASDMPDMGSFDTSEIPDTGSFDISSFGNLFGSMSSDDVKLKYIDDDPESYSNIFNNAKTDITEADETRLIQSLKNLTEYTDLESTVDMDEVLRYFVIHNFVVNGDSYTGTMIHNYYLHEDDGQLAMIPWDYNLAFGTFTGGDASSSVNADIDNPVSNGSTDDRPMVGWIFSDETYTEQYHELFSEFISEWIDSGKLAQLISDTEELISPYVESDPTKFCTTEEFETGVDTLSEFVSLRGEAVSAQLNGDDTPIETDGLNCSDMGSMNSTGSTGGFSGTTVPSSFDFSGASSEPDAGTDTAAESSSDSTETPQMPAGTSNTSEFPEMPTGTADGVEMPQMPVGTADASGFPQMTGAAEDAEAEQVAGDAEVSQTPSGRTDEADTSQSPSNIPSFSGTDFSSFSNVADFSGAGSTSSSLMNWIFVGISILVLIAGLLIAIRKKR